MMRATYRTMVAATAGLILGASAALADGPTLTGKELKSLFSGSTLYTSDIRGFFLPHDFEWEFAANGTVNVSYTIDPDDAFTDVDPQNLSDTGTWQIKGNQMCVKFKQLFHKALNCFTVRRALKAPKLYGSHMFRATMAGDGHRWLFAIDK